LNETIPLSTKGRRRLAQVAAVIEAFVPFYVDRTHPIDAMLDDQLRRATYSAGVALAAGPPEGRVPAKFGTSKASGVAAGDAAPTANANANANAKMMGRQNSGGET